MRNIFIKWLVGLAILHKLGNLLARLITSAELLFRFAYYLHPRVLHSSLGNWWGQRSHFSRRLLTNMVVGLGITLVLSYLHHAHNAWLIEFEDAGMDWMMRLHAGTTVSDNVVPLAWIEIDEHTYREWGEPLYTPRDKLKALIEFAASSDALVIVVDIDLSRKSDDEESDAKLIKYLANYSASPAPPLIFVRTFREPIEGTSLSCREVRASFIENNKSVDGSGKVFSASALFTKSKDKIIRRWRLWEPACTEGGSPVVLPSIQLLVAAIVKGSDSESADAAQGLVGQLHPFTPLQCSSRLSSASKNPCHPIRDEAVVVNVGDLVLDSSPSHIQQRLVYNIPWQMPSSGLFTYGNAKEPLFIRHPASPITAAVQKVDKSWLSGRIVIIGSSYSDARDNHATPIGEQPGALILANAINSLLQYGQIQPLATWKRLLIEAFLILIISLVFARFNSFWGMLVSGMTVIFLLLPASFVLFKYGVWLDFAIPLIAVQLHQMAAEFEESREQGSKLDV